MAETRRKFDQDFKEGAVRLVRETGRPIAQVAKDLGINESTLGNWVNADKRRRGEAGGALSEGERAELARLRRENAELAIGDVLERRARTRVTVPGGRAASVFGGPRCGPSAGTRPSALRTLTVDTPVAAAISRSVAPAASSPAIRSVSSGVSFEAPFGSRRAGTSPATPRTASA